MTVVQILELALAAAIFAAGVWFYRRPTPGTRNDDQPGGQGAVLLFVVAVLIAIHGLGLMDYRPSGAERDAMVESGQ